MSKPKIRLYHDHFYYPK